MRVQHLQCSGVAVRPPGILCPLKPPSAGTVKQQNACFFMSRPCAHAGVQLACGSGRNRAMQKYLGASRCIVCFALVGQPFVFMPGHGINARTWHHHTPEHRTTFRGLREVYSHSLKVRDGVNARTWHHPIHYLRWHRFICECCCGWAYYAW